MEEIADINQRYQSNMLKFNKTIILAMLLCGTALYGQPGQFESGGYLKYLFSSTENELLSPERLNDHQLHLRLNNRWYINDNLMAALEIRTRAFQGGTVETLPGFTRRVVADYPYGDLDIVYHQEETSFAYSQVDRLYLDVAHGNWQVTAGRQRIAWGTSFVWNIVDLFNPQSILDFDYEERPGGDALRIQYYTGPVGRIEVAAQPAKNRYERTIAAQWLYNRWNYDFFLIVARFHEKPLAGFAFSGNIAGAGFRGELRYTGVPDRERLSTTLLPGIFGHNFSDAEAPNISTVLSLDYTFANSLRLHSEALFNSIGKSEDAGLFTAQAARAGLLSPARWSLFQQIRYQIHPLLQGSAFMLFNPQDQSAIYVPSLSWSLSTNLDFFLIAFFSDGSPFSEFGSAGNTVFSRLKYSF